jgi:hypothetical protein
LSLIELLGCHKGLEVLMIRDDVEGFLGAGQLWAPFFQCFDDR